MKKTILLIWTICLQVYTHAQSGPILLGMTSSGGANNEGTIIKYRGGDSALTSFVSLDSFSSPYSSTLTEAPNGKMYGLVCGESVAGLRSGSLIEYDYNTNIVNTKVHFTAATGENPMGSLLLAKDGRLYGMGQSNGTIPAKIFSYTPGDTFLTRIVNMPNMSTLYGSLINAFDGRLYGMTYSGGTNQGGTIFRYDIDSNTFTVLYSLPAGANPKGDLLEAGRDTFYGLTYGDGPQQSGTLFMYTASTGQYRQLWFVNSGGFASPEGTPILGSNGNIYCLIPYAGYLHLGSILLYDTRLHGTREIYNFGIGTDGRPLGELYHASDGRYYGLASQGGAHGHTSLTNSGYGTIFHFAIDSEIYTLDVSLDSASGRYPKNGHLTEYFPPAFVFRQPANVSVCNGATASFIASAGNSVSVQWQVSTDGGHNYTNIAGATDTLYSFLASDSQNGNLYRAVFTHAMVISFSTAASLNIYRPGTDTILATICRGNGYIFGSNNFTTEGIYNDTLPGISMHGCDSIRTLLLSLYPETPDTVVAVSCPGAGYIQGIHTYTTSGIYTDTLTSIHGCDSIVVLELAILDSSVIPYFSLQPANAAHFWYAINQCYGNQLSYVWNWGDGSPNGTGDTPSHTYASPGYYTICVTVTDSIGCTASYCDSNVYMYKNENQMVQLDVVKQIPTGINATASSYQSIKYYSGAIHFSEAIVDPSHIRLYDISGRKVMEQGSFTGDKWSIDRGITSGVYTIHMENDSYSISHKIVVTR